MIALALIGALILGALLWLAAEDKVKRARRAASDRIAIERAEHDAELATQQAIHDEQIGRLDDDLADAENRLYLAEVDNAVLREELHWARLTVAVMSARDDLGDVLGNGRPEVVCDNVIELRGRA